MAFSYISPYLYHPISIEVSITGAMTGPSCNSPWMRWGQNETLDRRWGVGWPQEHQKTTEKTWRRIFDHFPMDFLDVWDFV